ncbi:hypothetical protein BB561_003948 [Smittium simulii]|uniref:Endonuclease/exonuclease/phosphatase domain-containing protein n=1 Tax=Smittium simulii TaxID=133385 RepID=A0A2T9YIV2_9FUNG|nr:hypothetical protein BB561_003948 [Smittium simulii]
MATGNSRHVSFKTPEFDLDIDTWGPGKLQFVDCRAKKYELQEKSLSVVSWNIERGYQLEKIIKKLKNIDADILCLQELDIFNERSGNNNQLEILCQELGLNGCFVTEFVEHKSPQRSVLHQGGGMHGNAILSKFDFTCESAKHNNQPYNWDADGEKLGEPRTGGL